MKTLAKITIILFVVNSFLSCGKDDGPEVTPNGAPTISDQSFTVAENIADNMPIGTVEATDPDGDTLSFSISTNDGNLFEINEAGELSLADEQNLDFETAESHIIGIRVTDGRATASAVLSITITDISDTFFVTTWETVSSNETVTIPTRASEFTYDYTIDWGDGTTQSGRTGDAMHTYSDPGIFRISISGNFPAIILGSNDTSRGQLRTVEEWGNIQWLTMEFAFSRINNLAINATDVPDLTQVTNMVGMFAGSQFNQDIGNWDVSNVTDMSLMFSLTSFNQDIGIGTWNVVNVTDMSQMFINSAFNQDIGDWNVSNVTDMSGMFLNSTFNQDIGAWNVSNVTDMSGMFLNSVFNQGIGSWNVTDVTDMKGMFNNSPFNQDIGSWDVGNVTDMSAMFFLSPFNQDISAWNVGNVTNMHIMFRFSSFNQGINTWNVSNVTNMAAMFADSPFNQNIGSWNVVNVTNMSSMFLDSVFNQDLSNWNVSNVTVMTDMFRDSAFNDKISTWNVANVTSCNNFALNAPLTSANTPSFTNCLP